MDRTAILNGYVTDMAAVEQHILDAVERQLASDDTSAYPDAVRTLSTLKSTLESHVRSLESYNDGTEGGGVKDLFRLARATGTAKVSLRNLRRLRSPLLQTVIVFVGDDKILTWEAGRFPRVHALRRLLRLL